MKKLFNYALLAAALLIGVNVNADDVVSVAVQDGETTPYESLDAAFAALPTNSTITMTMLDDAEINNIVKLPAGSDITWDLKSFTVTAHNNANAGNGMIFVENAKLRLVGEVGATLVYDKGTAEKPKYRFISLYGTDDKTAESGYSYLYVDEKVTIDAYGYAVYVWYKANKASYGVLLDIYGTIKANPYGCIMMNGTIQAKEGKVPVVNIYGSAKLIQTCEANNDGAAIYAGGYAIWYINAGAQIFGCTGIYAKAGELNITGANISATGVCVAPQGDNDGFQGTGDGVVLDTHDAYAGGLVLNVSGNTSISSSNGYGIQEVITVSEDGTTHCEGIDIQGGTISGATDKGSITTSEMGKGTVDITGGTFNSDITDYLGGDNIIEPTKNDKGEIIYVISTKDPLKAWVHDITTAVAGDYVELTTDYNKSLTADVKAEYLVTKNNAKVTIPTGMTLTIGEIVMSPESQIIVEKGATLIVKGTKGIVANQASNIILKSEENAPAYFLLDPDVESNMTPKAMVQFTSGAYKINDDSYIFDFFGVPMGVVDQITSSSTDYSTNFYVNNHGTDWTKIGSIIKGVETDMQYDLFSRPFGFFEIQANNPDGVFQTLTFKGNVYGNSSPSVACQAGWPGFSNAYTGDVDVLAFSNLLEEQGFDLNIYTYTQVGNNTLVWTANNPIKMKESGLTPMRAFVLRNVGTAKNLALDYEAMVWDPAMEGPAGAPRMSNIEKATIRINGANGIFDELTVAQDESFDANCKYNAEKYMNTELNVYVKGEKNLAIAATDNLNNTFVGFNCKNAGKYTMSFEGVTGNFALVDTKTNARIEMSEGNTYEFLAEAGEDAYRFMIVEAAKAPTNTPANKAAVKATKALINDQIVISNGERFFNMLGTDVK